MYAIVPSRISPFLLSLSFCPRAPRRQRRSHSGGLVSPVSSPPQEDMVMETLDTDFVPGKSKDMTKEDSMDGKVKPVQVHGLEEPIKFGLVDNKQVTNGPAKEELDHNKTSNFPKDAVDEWPAPKQIHSFYLVKFRSYEDPKLKAKLDQADKEIQKYNQARFQLIEALKEKRSERSSVISQLKPLTAEDKSYRAVIDGKRKEIEPFQAALGKLRTAENARKSEGLCSSEQELNDLIKRLHFQLQHESNTIAEEKQILKDIKHLEGTREKVIANAAAKAKIGDSFGKREDMLGQVKQIGGDLDVVRKDQQAVRSQIKKLEDHLKIIDDDIKALQADLANVDNKRGKAYDTLGELRKARDDSNACFYQNRSLLNNVRNLAAKKDVAALEELCHAEVDKFMSQYNSKKAFRDDYERRVLPSLDGRQMSKDGRMRNPDEKPIIPVVAVSKEPEPVQPKGSIKRPKEDTSQPPKHDKVSEPKAHKEETGKSNEVDTKQTSGIVEDTEPSFDLGKSQKQSVVNEIDAAKLKEMKREEEIAKAKMALERKKKLAEKAEAKAAVRAQKEAEKKLREKEKKARKKAGASAPAPVENIETETTTEESELPEPNKEATLPSKSHKEQKDNLRYRNRQRGSVQLPKPILRRKKSTSYWVWAVPAAVLSLALMMLGYYYFHGKQQLMN